MPLISRVSPTTALPRIMFSRVRTNLLLCCLLLAQLHNVNALRRVMDRLSSRQLFAPKIQVDSTEDRQSNTRQAKHSVSDDRFSSRNCAEESKDTDSQILHDELDCGVLPSLQIISQDDTTVTFTVSIKSEVLPWFFEDCSPLAASPTTVDCEDGMAIVDMYEACQPCESELTCHVRYAIKCSPSKCATGGERLGNSRHAKTVTIN